MKTKFLKPIVIGCCVATPLSIVPVLSNCSKNTQETHKCIPAGYFDIFYDEDFKEWTLRGIREGMDIDQYDTLKIPEGVEAIYIDAFRYIPGINPYSFMQCGRHGNITRIIFPSTIKTIWDGAFNRCTSIEYWDFTSWTAQTIKDVHIFAFDEDPHYIGCFSELETGSKFILNENLDDESKQLLKKKTFNSGAWNSYWISETNDKISLKSTSVKHQTTKTNKVTYHFQMAEKFDDPHKVNLHLTLWPRKYEGSVGATCGLPVINADGSVDADIYFFNPDGAGAYIEFDLLFGREKSPVVEQDPTEPWRQSLTGFRIEYSGHEIKTFDENVVEVGDSQSAHLEAQNMYLARGCTYNIHVDMSKWTKKTYEETGTTAFNAYSKTGTLLYGITQVIIPEGGKYFTIKNETTGELIDESKMQIVGNGTRIEFDEGLIKHTDKLCLTFKSGVNLGSFTFEVYNYKD